jgi:hypothetical protein
MDVHTCTRPQKCASFLEWDAVDVFAGCGAGLRVGKVTPVVCCREQTTAPIRVRFACRHQQAQTCATRGWFFGFAALLSPPPPQIFCANLWGFIDFWLARWNGHANFLEAQKSTHEVSLAGCGGRTWRRCICTRQGKLRAPLSLEWRRCICRLS